MTISYQTETHLSSPDVIKTTEIQESENLWENPSKATEAMKKAIKQVKNKFNINQQWDGNFYL